MAAIGLIAGARRGRNFELSVSADGRIKTTSFAESSKPKALCAAMLIINHKIWVPILSRLTRRIGQALSQPLPKGNKIAHHLANPYLQVNTAQLAGWLEAYIHERLFNEPFDPMRDESWRVLLLQPVIDHNTKVFAMALIDSEDRKIEGETEVRHRALSEVPKLSMSERSSLPVIKCI